MTKTMPECNSLAKLRAEIISAARKIHCTLHLVTEVLLETCGLCFFGKWRPISSSSVARRHAALHTSTCPTAPTLTAEDMEAALGGVSDDELEMDEDEMRRGAT